MTAPTITARADLAAAINQEHKHAVNKAREALEHARRCGELLLQAKKRMPHGEWLPWLTDNCKFSARTATGYMRLASRWDELRAKSATVADLPLRTALAIVARPKASQHEVVAGSDHREHAGDGDRVRCQELSLDSIKIMPRGYWRTCPQFQPQFLASLVDAWVEASDDTRREFFLILHGRDEFMPVVDAATVKAAA